MNFYDLIFIIDPTYYVDEKFRINRYEYILT